MPTRCMGTQRSQRVLALLASSPTGIGATPVGGIAARAAKEQRSRRQRRQSSSLLSDSLSHATASYGVAALGAKAIVRHPAELTIAVVAMRWRQGQKARRSRRRSVSLSGRDAALVRLDGQPSATS